MYNVLARSRTQKLHEELKVVTRRLHNILTFFGYEYTHGIVIECCDEIKHRFYPRILTCSGDYLEK
jgi:hypothetical protein